MSSRAVNQWRRLLGIEPERQVASVLAVRDDALTLSTPAGIITARPATTARYAVGDRVTVQAGQVIGRARREPTVYVV